MGRCRRLDSQPSPPRSRPREPCRRRKREEAEGHGSSAAVGTRNGRMAGAVARDRQGSWGQRGGWGTERSCSGWLEVGTLLAHAGTGWGRRARGTLPAWVHTRVHAHTWLWPTSAPGLGTMPWLAAPWRVLSAPSRAWICPRLTCSAWAPGGGMGSAWASAVPWAGWRGVHWPGHSSVLSGP